MGCFEQAGEFLDVLDRMVERQPSKSLETRAKGLRIIYEEQSSMEEELSFEPQNSNDGRGANQQDEEEEATN